AAPGLGPVGLAVVAVAQVPTGTATGTVGVLPACAIAVVALAGFLLIRRSLVTPVLRLRADALRVASGDLAKPVRVPHTIESRRIALAFEHCRTTMSGESPRRHRPRRGLSARAAVIVATVGVLGWSAGMALLATRHEVTVQESVVTGLRDQTASTGAALRHSLGGGLADLKAVATLNQSADTAALRPVLDRLHATQSRYRSVYLVDKDGRARHVAGRKPLRASIPPPSVAGVRQDGGSRVAVLYAHVPLPEGAAVIGEFDIDRIAELLRRAPGKVRLLDADLRTLAATDGYVAFEKVSADRLRRGVEAVRGGGTAQVLDGSAVVVATALHGGEATGSGWSVVAEKPVGELALADNTLRRNALVVAVIGALLAMLLFGWHHFLLVRPLRALAERADRLVAGDLGTVLHPQRHDQIGTLVSCLEICRQGVVDGIDRLGEVRRPRGTATEATVLIPRIDAPTPVRRPEALSR
ncbi:HAMP domain-containing protein, partial [Actinokineospora sp.]|uniref:HAMP domain-containing protein n=1 Tax=Actinokineospora sp. TaxID=1872133 RepID=UPI003D6BCF30